MKGNREMKIYEVRERTPRLAADLLDIWKASVRATHHFLSDAEITQIKEYVPQALRGVSHLIIMEIPDIRSMRQRVKSCFMNGHQTGMMLQISNLFLS